MPERDWTEKAGTPGPRATYPDMEARNLQIVAAADRGITGTTLARQYGLSATRVQTIIRNTRAARWQELADGTHLDHIQDTLAYYESAIEELALFAANVDRSEKTGVWLAAVKTKIEIVQARWSLLQAIGRVPSNLTTVRVELEAAEVGQSIVRVLEAYSVEEGVMDAILDVVEGREPDLPALEAGSEAG